VGQVKTWKESDQARGTHQLETTEGGTSQDTEKKGPSKGHSLPGDHRERVKAGHGKKATKQGALTSWRPQREGKSGHGKKVTKQGALTSWRPQKGGDKSRHRKKVTKQGALTSWRSQREGQVRTWKESN